MKARIFKPTRSAMQSGKANIKNWVLEFDPSLAKEIEPLMGWNSSEDMSQEVRIKFSSKENAIKFAKDNNIDYEVYEPELKKINIQAYADNFK